MSLPKAKVPQGRIPSEFRYWDNIEKKGAKRQRKLIKLAFGFDPKLPDAIVREYAEHYFAADPVAEAFVEEVYLSQGQSAGRKLLDEALAKGVDALDAPPQSLLTLFREIEVVPPWLDWQQVELGARVFRRYATHLYSFAGAITLEGYRENSVAKPLAFTGAYTGESANRRFLETAGFWVDVSAPGALRPGGKGIEIALRVRIMHVFVRRRLLAHPKWDLEAWGVPISQGDALLTLMGGSLLPGIGLRALGYRTSNAEILALLHFWRYVGHLLGVQPTWYPESIKDAIGLMFTAFTKGVQGAGEDAINLAQSYVDSYLPVASDPLLTRIDKWIEHKLQLGYVSLFIPPQSYKHFALPNPGLMRLHPFMQFLPRFAFESVRMKSQPLDNWYDSYAQRKAKRWLQSRLGERSTEYQAVEHFTR